MKQIEKKNISQALGTSLFLFVLLFFLSVYGSLWPLGYAVIWLGGYTFYYLGLPLLGVYSLFLLFKGHFPKLSLKVHLGIISLLFGFLFLFGLLNFLALNKSVNDIFNVYQNFAKNTSGEITINLKVAGGVPFTALNALLSKDSLALVIVFVVILFALGLFLILFTPVLAPLARKISLNRSKKKALKASEEAYRRKEAEEALLAKDESSSNEPFSYKEEVSQSEDQPFVEHIVNNQKLPSRFDNRDTFSSSPLAPEEIKPPFENISPSLNEIKKNGLSEAHFSLDEKPSSPVSATFIAASKESLKAAENNLISETTTNAFIEEKKNTNNEIFGNVLDFSETINKTNIPSENKVEEAKEETSISKTEPTYDNPFVKEEIKEEVPFVNVSLVSKETKEEPLIPSINEKVDEQNPEILAKEPSKDNVAQEMKAEGKPEILINNVLQEEPEPVIKEEIKEEIKEVEPEVPATPVPPAKPTMEQLLDNIGMPHKKPRKKFVLPPVELLKEYPKDPESEQEKLNCERRKETINEAFRNFNIGAHVEDYTIGPSVTRYNIRTDSDVSVNSIPRIIDDIAIRLEGAGIRFESIVRNRSTSGLEVPNNKTSTVSLKRMVSALPPLKGEADLNVPFGVNIDDKPIFAKLNEFPHLLVAGTTGSGKSVFINGLIMSLIMRNSPDDVKLVLVDPKRVELSKYHDLPHLLCPVVKEPSEAKVCLDKLLIEMDNRYKAFECSGVKDIKEWNEEFVPTHDYARLPYIVVFIDEFADLVDTCKNIQEPVVRLAQKARACGIHLVIATQRPTVQVITGTIKANIIARVALSMSSAIDSNTILSQKGAEELIGNGDMLVDCPQVARTGFTRCQGCYCSGSEINAVCDYIRNQREPEFNPFFLDLVDHENVRSNVTSDEGIMPLTKSELKAQSNEDFYNHVKETIMTQQYTSISKIQREFQIGFPRAGRIFAQLQKDGIVAKDEAGTTSKGCKVLVHVDINRPASSITLSGDND